MRLLAVFADIRGTRVLPVALLAMILALPAFATGEEAVAGQVTDGAAPEASAASKTSRLQGSAFIDRRTKVTGASVMAQCPEHPRKVWLTATDEKGQFRAEGLRNGDYTVQIFREGLAPVRKDRVEVLFPYRAVVELPMARQTGVVDLVAQRPRSAKATKGPAELEGRVWGEDGEPIGEVLVRLLNEDGAADPRVMRTDGNGDFWFEDLIDGGWRLEIQGLGYLPIRVNLEIEGTMETKVLLIKQPASYTPSPIDLLPHEQPTPPPAAGKALRADN
ncbi:hypothetical protein ABI59_11180 [Acidobacteria bacterium Mor1]|nr:hypothetical protein ABI59_11180 [Acidobacteria bacterium Mor1]